MTTLLLATRNQHKIHEIRGILGTAFDYLSLNDFPNAPQTVEDANSFAGNATKKSVELARYASQAHFTHHALITPKSDEGGSRITDHSYVLADDSGLEVDALNGAPGVHSARFAALDKATATNSPSSENNAKLLHLLKEVPADKRTARFRCVLALTPVLPVTSSSASPVCAQDGYEFQTELFEGTCEGWIGFEPKGEHGFGYDPLFVPNWHKQTFAELGDAIKNELSHRAKALESLKQRLSSLECRS